MKKQSSLFGSGARVDILKLFLANDDCKFYIREVQRRLDLHINAVRRELINLEGLGILKSEPDERKVVYFIDPKFPFKKELGAMILKW